MDKLLLKGASHTVIYYHKYQNMEQENLYMRHKAKTTEFEVPD